MRDLLWAGLSGQVLEADFLARAMSSVSQAPLEPHGDGGEGSRAITILLM